MAYYTALVSLVQFLKDVVLHHDLYSGVVCDSTHEILESLLWKFICLEEDLQGYSSKGTEATDGVEIRIRDVAFQVQDIIECKISDKMDLDKQTACVVYRWVIFAFQKALCLQQGLESECNQDLLKLGEEVEHIMQKVAIIKESQRNEDSSHMNYYSAETIESEQAPDAVVGLEKYLTIIKEQLCGHSSQLQVIPIVGMGGIGKTTLAKTAFDDGLIQYYFDCRAWITVSQDYHISRVLHNIAQSFGIRIDNEVLKEDEIHREENGAQKIEELMERIYKHLKGRRYMIVLDDIWSTKVLDDLRHILPNDNNGSRIMLTTRLFDVSDYHTNRTGFIHKMPFLNEGQSWDLLRKKVFVEEQCPPELEDIGKFIASKCHGLPLAIVVMAGILSSAQTPLIWEKVAKKVSTMLNRSHDEHLSNILSFSYNHLSHQLKACFLYMGCFPEDYIFNISKLIKLWMAEGLLKSVNRSKTMEQMGEECVVDLVKRNLVVVTQKRATGQFKFCIVHDILREFCRQRAFHEHFFHVEHQEGFLNPTGVKILRRICLYHSHPHNLIPRVSAKLVHSILCFSDRFRSLLLYGKRENQDFNVSEWDNFKLLRVLDAPREQTSIIKKGLWEMAHLRYLCLYVHANRDLMHDSVLHNLQTLIVHQYGHSSRRLPSQIWKWTQLRHLLINRMRLPPFAVGILGDLQTLSVVEDFPFTYVSIETFPNLRKLKIHNYIWSAYQYERYDVNILVHLPQLEELNVCFDIYEPSAIAVSSSFRYLESFAFPFNLRKLSVKGCRRQWGDMSMVGSLPLLQVLKLGARSFMGDIWEPVEGEFLRLKTLMMDELDLYHWRAETTHFPCLARLEIYKCYNLQEIPLEIGDIPTLQNIYIANTEHAKDSAIRILEEQQNQENDVLQVRFFKRKMYLGQQGFP